MSLLQFLFGRRVSVYCDGSSDAVRGRRGGWAFAVVERGACLHSDSGGQPRSSSHGMELEAALQGLSWVLAQGWGRRCAVELVSDSKVALEAASGERLPINGRALAEALRARFLEAGATTRWVRGHAGEPWNELCDRLAREARLSPRSWMKRPPCPR